MEGSKLHKRGRISISNSMLMRGRGELENALSRFPYVGSEAGSFVGKSIIFEVSEPKLSVSHEFLFSSLVLRGQGEQWVAGERGRLAGMGNIRFGRRAYGHHKAGDEEEGQILVGPESKAKALYP